MRGSGEVAGTGLGPTWRTLRRQAVEQLRAAGIAPAVASEARWLAEEASGFEGVEHEAVLDLPATAITHTSFQAMLARRLAGEPLQYVLGHWAFRTLDLKVDQRVLIPRPETEQVVEFALAEIDRLHATTVADLGVGSGAIALSLAAERKTVEVWATDSSPEALAVARLNQVAIGRPAARVHIREGSWFDGLPPELRGTLGVVVSNPPYIAADEELPAEVIDWEPAGALVSGVTGLEAIEAVVREAPAWLARPGALVVEIAPHQAKTVAALASEAGFTEVDIRRDLSGRQRALVARIGGE